MELLQYFKTDDIETILENFLDQEKPTPYEVQLILKLLAEIGVDRVHTNNDVMCPETKVPISAPCSLDQCHFHIDFPTAANCLLVYMDQQKSDSVSLGDQTYLYNQSYYDIKKIYKRAALKIKSYLFREWAAERGLSIFEFYPTMAVCCNCESYIPDRTYITYRKEYVYCSEECYTELPPKRLDLEVSFGMHYEDLAVHLPKCFGPTTAEEILK